VAQLSAPPKAAYPLPRPGQIQLFIRAYAPFDTFGRMLAWDKDYLFVFGGDRRTGPSTNTAATARVTCVVVIDLQRMLPSAADTRAFCDPSHGSGSLGIGVGRMMGGSREGTGSVTRTARARSRVLFEPIGPSGSGYAGSVEVEAANPLLPSPDIDLRLNLRMTKEDKELHVSGNLVGDAFPNAEAFLRDSLNTAVLLADFRTSGDRDKGPRQMLIGQGTRWMSGFDAWLKLSARGGLG